MLPGFVESSRVQNGPVSFPAVSGGLLANSDLGLVQYLLHSRKEFGNGQLY